MATDTQQHLAYYLGDVPVNKSPLQTEQSPGRRHKGVRQTDITKFLRQLAGMMRAGIPLMQCFDLLSQGNPPLKPMIEQIKSRAGAGKSLSSALREQPHFNALLCNLIEIGEQTGILDDILERIACDREKHEKLRGQIRAALTYPIAVLLVAMAISGLLLTKVVPQFETMFQSFQVELPIFTQWVIRLSEWFRHYWLTGLAGLIGLAFAGLKLYKKQSRFALLVDRLLLACPLLGTLIQKAILARYAYTLATTFNAGAPLAITLSAIAGSIGNQVYAHAISAVAARVTAGQSIASAMQRTGVFPPLMMQMVNIGEESGQIAEMLSKITDYYETDVETTVGSLTRLLEPVMMCLLGLLVGGLIVAMYLPVFNLGSVLNGGF